MTCHEVATVVSGLIGCVQFNRTELAVTNPAVSAVGILHDGGGPHVILLTHPAAVVVAFDVNTKVKVPADDDAVKDGGRVVPVNVAKSGAVTSLPSYTLKKSDPF